MEKAFNESVKFSEKSLKRDFNEFNESVNNNRLSVGERDYMISTAMRLLGISPEWHDAVARGANYLDGDKFWQLVDYARSPRIRNKARYFVGAIGRELARRGLFRCFRLKKKGSTSETIRSIPPICRRISRN